ncbi:hypothetical protein L6164_012067 [Bauhinia variegata]|uniref:Uncharacterized protein n=1 Tax=Bauhinia variegata TaxID=167791 RepID=A0ACB9P8V8_BAUVA|nr:hypothetical protein L6164_012067 [Bauhinia variegata]
MLIREIGCRTVVSTQYEMAIGRSQEHNFDNDIKIFNFKSIVTATNNFLVANKLGQGGFGSIYKAWQLWNEDKVMELIDISLLDCCPTHEALRCVQLALLCEQDRAADRTSMLEIVSTLSNESALMPAPIKPTFYIDEEKEESNESEEKQNAFSINEGFGVGFSPFGVFVHSGFHPWGRHRPALFLLEGITQPKMGSLDEEEEIVVFKEENLKEETEECSKSLVGKVIALRQINPRTIEIVMMAVWGNPLGFRIKSA